jgi:hypothetical protein
MKRVVVGIAVLAAAAICGGYRYLFHPAVAKDYRAISVSAVHARLSSAPAGSVIFMGDSITALAPLPTQICGHPTINAGIAGIDVGAYVKAMEGFGQFRGAAIVVALGTNNSNRHENPETVFSEDYLAMLKTLVQRTPIVVLVGLPPIEEDGTASGILDMAAAERINRDVEAIAKTTGHQFVDLREAMSAGHLTVDGVHPSMDGFKVWLGAIEPKVVAALGCSGGI